MIGYLGPSGTFSHMAAQQYTGRNEPLTEFATIYALLLGVAAGQVERAIVPIENSIEGSVNTTLDTLAFDTDLYITDEYILPVTENLLGKPGIAKDQIQKIISHPQPIGQCSKMLSHDFPDVEIGFTESTARAAEIVAAGDGSVAMIGPAGCAEIYGLNVLAANCNDIQNNATRFVVVAKKPNMQVTDRDKTSIAFVLEDTPGSLYHALELFSKYQLNMIKIESRPIKTELGKYVFFIDIDGNIDDVTIYFALDKLKQNTISYKFLGSYPKAEKRG